MDAKLKTVVAWQTVQVRKDTTCSACQLPIYKRTGVVLRPRNQPTMRAARIHGECLPAVVNKERT
jgi:hypothetical protein